MFTSIAAYISRWMEAGTMLRILFGFAVLSPFWIGFAGLVLIGVVFYLIILDDSLTMTDDDESL